MMAYCGPRGIPYTTFLGDDNGWDDLSRAAALAWQADQDKRCQGCGQDRADWWERDENGDIVVTDDGYPKVRVPFAYTVETSYCPACDALERYREGATANPVRGAHPHFVPVVHPGSHDSDEVRSP